MVHTRNWAWLVIFAAGLAVAAAQTCSGGCCNPDGSIAVGGTRCRNPTGPCDEPAYCDGSFPACPPNPYKPASEVCRLSSGCHQETFCNGTSAVCPPASPKPKDTICYIGQGNPCRLTAHCDGESTTCPEVFEGDDTQCMWNPFDSGSLFKFVGKASPQARYVPPRKFGANCPGPNCDDDRDGDGEQPDYSGGHYGSSYDGGHHVDDKDRIYRRNSHYPTCEGVCSAGHCFKALDFSGCCVIDGMEHLEEGLYCWKQ